MCFLFKIFTFVSFTSLQPHLHDFADQHFARNPQNFKSFVLKVKEGVLIDKCLKHVYLAANPSHQNLK